ncbi:uncharacterized protein LOC123499568 [Portunus trituberculatus]|uniref:uncharacterized protein LOC123499568 n=1 Tax=Portunus trituberculatus TaxID=210409 RepID=UPI001E1D033B|nr:uncharacterized protein LOC123499568 [Portunus trituberculatus]
MSTSIEDPQEAKPKTNWCCILCIFVVAGGLCFFGVSLALQGDSRTGFVLLLSSGGLLALSICAAIGRFRPQNEEDKTTPSLYDDLDDQPPSYRQSWRRSFMRRIKNRNEGGEEDENTGENSDRRGRGRRKWWQRRGQREKDEEEGADSGEARGGRQSRRSSYRTANELYSSSSSSCDSLLAGLCGSRARGGAANERYTQSLSNLLDPPSYQDAIAHLDDAAIRKLRSEMCLPSAMQ